MAPALTGVVARHPRVYIKSLARALGEVPELDILLLATGGDPHELQFLVDRPARRTSARGWTRSASLTGPRPHPRPNPAPPFLPI